MVYSRSRVDAALIFVAAVLSLVFSGTVDALFAASGTVVGRNVNMVGRTPIFRRSADGSIIELIIGDPFLQKQNEPSVAVSSRNSMHLLAGANDYRSVNLEFADPNELPGMAAGGDSWLGLFKSFDGGRSWQSTLLPGFPQDNSAQGTASPIHGLGAGADPTVRAGTHGMFYYSGIAFDRGDSGQGAVFVSRLIDLNNREGAEFEVGRDPIKYIDTTVIDTGTSGQFLDKPWLAIDVPRAGARSATISVNDVDAEGNPITVSQTIPCGNAYLAYANFLGDTKNNIRSKVLVSTSKDCGATWGKPVLVNQSFDISQGVAISIDPRNGNVYVAWRQFSDSNEPDSIVIARSTDGGKKFSKATRVATLDPVDQPTRPAFTDDPFRMFRTNSYPAMAMDHTGRIYVAWAQRGHWGNDHDQNSALDGTRIVLKTSTDGGATWSALQVIESPTPEGPGHQLMPAIAYSAGKVVVLYYDFQGDLYPFGYDVLLDLFGNPDPVQTCKDRIAVGDPLFDGVSEADCDKLAPYDRSVPVADAEAFDPYPVRHTVDVYLAEAGTGNTPNIGFDIKKVSRYLTAIFARRDAGGNIVAWEPFQVRFNQVNFPLFGGGTMPFIGDYIDIAGTNPFITRPGNRTQWDFNGGDWDNDGSPEDMGTFHAVWTDNRDVVPPLPEFDASGKPLRLNWAADTGESTNGGKRNQNTYSARISPDFLLSSFGNSKPLNIERTFALFLENLKPPQFTTDGVTRGSRMVRLTATADGAGVETSFTPFDSASADLTVDVQANSSVAVTLFARTNGGDPLTAITVRATDAVTGEFLGALVLNGDPTNPPPLNADPDPVATSLLVSETHDPEFLTFSCADFVDSNGNSILDGNELFLASVFPACVDGETILESVTTLVTRWPSIVDPANPSLFNPSLFNPSLFNPSLFNPSLFNPSLFNPSLLNPSLFNPSLFNPSLFNPSLFNPSLFNPSLFNPSLFNPSLFNPSLFNPSLFNPSLFNPSLFNPSLFNPSLFNPSLFNPSLFNPSLFNPSLLNPSLFNPSLFNPSLFNTTLNDGLGSDYPEGEPTPAEALFNTDLLDPAIFGDGASITDFIWQVRNDGNNVSNYFFAILAKVALPDDLHSQLIIHRVYSAPTPCANLDPPDPTCTEQQSLHYEVLANIIDPEFLTPEDLQVTGQGLLNTTFTVNPGDLVFITFRTVDPDGPDGPLGLQPGDIVPVVLPQAEEDGKASVWTLLTAEPTAATFGQTITLTAQSGSYSGAPPTGQIEFFDNGASLGTAALVVSGGTSTATLSVSSLAAGTHLLTARFLENESFKCGVSENNVSFCDSAPVTVEIAKATPVVTSAGGTFTFDGLPHAATGEVLGVDGLPIAGAELTFTYTNTADGPILEGPPVDAGSYEAVAHFAGNSNYTAVDSPAATITIGAATPTVTAAGGSFTFDAQPHPATGAVLGVDGLPIAGAELSFTYTNDADATALTGPPVDAGSYTAVAHFAGNANYTAADSPPATITIAQAVPVVTAAGGAFTFDGLPHAATAQVLGVDGLPISGATVTLTYTPPGDATVPVDAGQYSAVAHFAGNANYTAADSLPATITIDQATPVVTATGGAFTFDGLPHAATGEVFGVGGLPIAGAELTFTYTNDADATALTGPPVDAGSYTAVAHFAGNANYTAADSPPATITIAQAVPVVTAAGGTFTFDGLPHAATAQVLGVDGLPIGGATVTFTYTPPGDATVPVDAGQYSAVAHFAGNANYTAADSPPATITIARADATVAVVGGTFTYDGQPHAATGSVTGVLGEGLGTPVFTYTPPGDGTVPVNAGVYEVVGSFAGNDNYNPAEATATITIDKAVPTVAADGGTFTYDTLPHPATGAVTGVLGENLGTPVFGYTNDANAATLAGPPVDAGSYTAVGSFAGDINYTAADSPPVAIVINQAATTSAVSVSPSEVTVGVSVTVSFSVEAVAPGAGSPTGAVTVSDATGVVCSGTLDATSSGSCSFTTSTVGLVALTAVYSGDSNFLASTSDAAALTVFYQFVGFFDPLGPPPGPYSFNFGRTIPVKWQILDAAGNFVTIDPTLFQVVITEPDGEMVTPAGGTELRSTDQYVFNWDTAGLTEPGTYIFTLLIPDGQTIAVQIVLN